MNKDKIKNIILVMLVAVVSGSLSSILTTNSLSGNKLLGSVSYSDYLDSSKVTYSNSNVQDSIDNLYIQANDYSSINNRVTSLESNKAPLENPSFTGLPLTPTASLNSYSNQIASTSYVENETRYVVGTDFSNYSSIIDLLKKNNKVFVIMKYGTSEVVDFPNGFKDYEAHILVLKNGNDSNGGRIKLIFFAYDLYGKHIFTRELYGYNYRADWVELF